MGDGTLKEYDLKEEKPTATELFKFPMGGDGLAIDSENNFYAALGDNTVRVMDAEGNEKQTLYFEERPTSITFGGEDMKTVLITTENKVYTIPANVQGLEMDEVAAVPQKKAKGVAKDADMIVEEEEDADLIEGEVISGSVKDEKLIRPTEKLPMGEEDMIVEQEEETELEEELEERDVIEELPMEDMEGEAMMEEEEEEEELEERDVIEELPMEDMEGEAMMEEEEEEEEA